MQHPVEAEAEVIERLPNAGIVVELFCGIGGMALGARRAGVQVDRAYDQNQEVCDIYRSNLTMRPAVVSVFDLNRILDGWSPPHCALFIVDNSNTRPFIDNLHVFDIINRWRPQCWISTAGPIDMNQSGYCIDRIDLNLADFGGPQIQGHSFWFGHRVGTPHIVAPEPTHGSPRVVRQIRLDELIILPWSLQKVKTNSLKGALHAQGMPPHWKMPSRGAARIGYALEATPPILAEVMFRAVVAQMEKS